MMQSLRARLTLLMVAALAVGLVFAACAPTEEDPAPRLGVLLPVTGDLGFLGGPMAQAAELAVIQANAAGGVLGEEIQYLFQDDGTDDDAARDGAETLVEVQGVQVFVGAAGSDQSMVALTAVSAPNQVVQISPSSTAEDFTHLEAGLTEWFFRTAPSDVLQGAVTASLVYGDGHETVAILAIQTTYGIGFADIFEREYTALGGEVIETVGYDGTAATFASEVEALQAAGADAVVLVGFPETGAVILREAFEQGVLDTETWYLSEGLRATDLVDNVGTDEDGNIIVAGIRGTQPSLVGPAIDSFISAYEEQWGETPEGPFDAHTYDAAVLAILAIEHAGVYDAAAIRESLFEVSRAPGIQVSDIAEALELLRNGDEIHYVGASSAVDFDDVGDIQAPSYEVWQITADGAFEVIDTVVVSDGDENNE